MFRNWLNGSRDMYISSSVDGGNTFGNTKKLGSGTWKLNGCPMDGGGLTINARGTIETVWRRQNKIFTSTSIGGEHEIGEGRDCTITQVNDIKIYGWVEKGYVVITRAGGEKKKLGKGNQLVMTALDKDHLICVWENENQIHASTIEL
ncbi:MAG: hypothetical protein ABJA57_05110 [Ginsengibacter sp.]